MSGSATQERLSLQHRDRWSDFGNNPSILELSERLTPADLKRFEIFEPYKDAQLQAVSPDITVATWEGGAVLFEEGSHIDVAFYVLSGEVQVSVESLAAAAPIYDTNRTSAAIPMGSRTRTTGVLTAGKTGPSKIPLLTAMDFDLGHGDAMRLGAGEFFGEIGALCGWPQSVTARTATQCQLIQIRLPALRALRRRSKPLKQKLDQTYRERSLLAQLRSTPLFAGCDEALLSSLAESMELVSLEPGEVVAREGEAAEAMYLVRSGFLKLEQQFGEGELAVSYLSKGMTFGELELLTPDLRNWESTARSAEYAELVKIPPAAIERLLAAQPNARDVLWSSTLDRIAETGASRRDVAKSEFIQLSLDTGLVQGSSMLVIDTERCTRCDDCVRACAATHGGRPRFVREGEKVKNLLIARSCYHCRDPVCLVGCPTGAIRRTGIGEVVEIDDDICIGCGTCSESCPYDNIVMHETGKNWPDDMVPEGLRGEPRRIASKCDQCQSQGHEPACVSNCPQGCAHRVGSIDELSTLLRGGD